MDKTKFIMLSFIRLEEIKRFPLNTILIWLLSVEVRERQELKVELIIETLKQFMPKSSANLYESVF